VAPEVLHGTPSSSSDQYSLALVYQELLTGEFPYTGRTPQQLMLQHVSGKPNLAPLPPCDQPVVEMALAKQPEGRFPSCLAFVQALMSVEAGTSLPSSAMNVRRARVDRSVAEQNIGGPAADYPGDEPSDGRGHTTHTGHHRRPEQTQNFTLPGRPSATLPGGRTVGPLPPLVSGTSRAALRGPAPSRGPAPPPSRHAAPPPTPPPSFAETPAPLAEEHADHGLVVLERIFSVMPVASLIGMASGEESLDPHSFANAVVLAAAGTGQVPLTPGEVGRLADGAWVCQFPSTVPASVVPLKLAVLRETWGVSIEQPDASHLVLRRAAGGGGLFGGKKFGYEVSVRLPPPGKPVGEVTVLGRTYGNPDPKCVREAQDLLPKLLEDVRGSLANAQDRRRHPRVACELPITLYPVHSDGAIDAIVDARCRDVCPDGVGFATAVQLQTKYVYAAFTGVSATAGQAVLLRLLRTQTVGAERHYGAQFRTDL
jgi:serine/threonine protein kinase